MPLKITCRVVIIALLHASCAPVTQPAALPFPPSGEAVPLLPPALKLPSWWPQGLPAPTKEPIWMTYPESWRET